jgi:hypothetical protein
LFASQTQSATWILCIQLATAANSAEQKVKSKGYEFDGSAMSRLFTLDEVQSG